MNGDKPRGYSREFPIQTAEVKRLAYTLDRISPRLWAKVQAKCDRECVSKRAAILRLLTLWVKEV